jgi:hypothetical protein
MPKISLGDTVQYTSRDGALKIEFKNGSPFVASNGSPLITVRGNQTVTVARKGRFECGCSLTLENGEVIGWKRETPTEHEESGGVHDVRD